MILRGVIVLPVAQLEKTPGFPALVPLIATLFESPELLSLFNYSICHTAFPMAARYGVSIPARDFTCDGHAVPHRDKGEQDWELQRHFTHENPESDEFMPVRIPRVRRVIDFARSSMKLIDISSRHCTKSPRNCSSFSQP